MIRLLTENDLSQCMAFLYQEPEYNIFPIGDIEAFGIRNDFVRVYGEFNVQGILLSILLRYREHAVYYASEIRFNDEYLSVFKKDPFSLISGKKELLMLIEPYLSGIILSDMYFCKATELVGELDDTVEIKILKTEEEAGKLHDLLMTISAFQITNNKVAFIKGKLDSIKMGLCLYIEKDGKIVSTVSTTAETTKSAMVVAVATDKDYRKMGYASILMKKLMSLYINEKKKSLCLFYDNPQAGNIYLRLGFKEIGLWTMSRRE
ncbi:MAG: GNAT family N-acetyltransferase [Sphaerochaetaceae bacterium]|nr:GNAT family N-acetyltransferase [Sphaerochaetaceae bacterium]